MAHTSVVYNRDLGSFNLGELVQEHYLQSPNTSLFETFNQTFGTEGDIDETGTIVGGEWAWVLEFAGNHHGLCKYE